MATAAETSLKTYRLYIDGQWVDPVDGEWFETINPATGRPWARIPRGKEADVDRAVAAAQKALKEWRRTSPFERARLLRRLAALIPREADRLAEIETRDNGKLIRETSAYIKNLPKWFEYFAAAAEQMFGEVIPLDKPSILNYTLREPYGVVAGIVPWNSPLFLAVWKMAPALAAGNTFVWKPSEHTSASALEFAPLFEEAGFPPGVVNIVTGFGPEAGAALTSHPDVNKVAFTGGSEAARKVVAGTANNLAALSLELGGKSPNIVFADADLDAAFNGVLAGIFAACGQTCVAGSRLLVQRSILDQLTERLVERTRTIRLGDPLKWETEMGPIATREQWDKIDTYCRIGKEQGAELVYGGQAPDREDLREGWFYEPTIFRNVTPDMRIFQEEIFGPVLAITPFDDEEEAIELANSTRYGLAAGVWTRDLSRAHRMARRLEAGTVWINTYRNISFASPFGGFKWSGYGRENGVEALKYFTQVKSVWVEMEADTSDPFVVR